MDLLDNYHVTDQQKRYIVMTGIFRGLRFKGHPCVINGEKRIWNDETVGNSYLEENCEELHGQ